MHVSKEKQKPVTFDFLFPAEHLFYEKYILQQESVRMWNGETLFALWRKTYTAGNI